MIRVKTPVAVCLGIALCTAQAINITGRIVDADSVGISGAQVKLAAADLSATTDPDGSFVLTSGTTRAIRNPAMASVRAGGIQLEKNRVTFSLAEDALVSVAFYSTSGRLLSTHSEAYVAGRHSVQAPLRSSGIYVCRMTIGTETFSFRYAPFGTLSFGTAAGPSRCASVAGLTKAAVATTDMIVVEGEGWLDYRDSIKTSDTSGIVIVMLPNAGDVTDQDDNMYQSVQIGNLIWTTENLRTVHFNDGAAIPHAESDSLWANIAAPAYCFHNNSDNTLEHRRWGALYNGYAANSGRLAPAGWRVPTEADWTALSAYLIDNGYNWDGSTSGAKEGKALAAKTYWQFWGTEGSVGHAPSRNNASGFSALPAGGREPGGRFSSLYGSAVFWSARAQSSSTTYYYFLVIDSQGLGKHTFGGVSQGFSVRLVRDAL